MEGKRITIFRIDLSYDELSLIVESLAMRAPGAAFSLANSLEALLESDSE